MTQAIDKPMMSRYAIQIWGSGIPNTDEHLRFTLTMTIPGAPALTRPVPYRKKKKMTSVARVSVLYPWRLVMSKPGKSSM